MNISKINANTLTLSIQIRLRRQNEHSMWLLLIEFQYFKTQEIFSILYHFYQIMPFTSVPYLMRAKI